MIVINKDKLPDYSKNYATSVCCMIIDRFYFHYQAEIAIYTSKKMLKFCNRQQNFEH